MIYYLFHDSNQFDASTQFYLTMHVNSIRRDRDDRTARGCCALSAPLDRGVGNAHITCVPRDRKLHRRFELSCRIVLDHHKI